MVATYEGPAGQAALGYHFHLTDWLGTNRMQVSPGGGQDEICTSYPFGDGLSCTGPDATEHHFTAKERDNESGLDYFHARYLNSGLGRFMTPDRKMFTLGRKIDPQQWNMYAYVRNNPFNFVDPDGKDLVTILNNGGVLVTVDSSIRTNVISFSRAAAGEGINLSFNVGFRTTADQAGLYASRDGSHPVAAPGTSPHEAGVAVDINGVRQMSSSTQQTLSDLGSANGLPWAGRSDWMHFGVFHGSDFPGGREALHTLIKEDQAQNDNGEVPYYAMDYETTTTVTDSITQIDTESAPVDDLIPEEPLQTFEPDSQNGTGGFTSQSPNNKTPQQIFDGQTQ
jgi:RHS repeat-associated protein